MSNKRRVYLSGPMRGYDKYNFPAFDRFAAAGREVGWDVISPADMDRDIGIDENSLDDANLSTPEAQRGFARRDVEAILSLRPEEGDAFALMPGWERSTGALAELSVARWVGLPILDARSWEPFRHGDVLMVNWGDMVDRLEAYFLADSSNRFGEADDADDA